jgi:hypothetical protein
MSTPQTFLIASSTARLTDYGVAQANLARACTATRPTSTRLEPVLDLRGFDHWFLHSYTFLSRLPDPGRLVVPARPVVVGAAPTLSCVPKIGLPPASAGRCDGPQGEASHLPTVNGASWRTTGFQYTPVASIATVVTSRSANQPARARTPADVVLNRALSTHTSPPANNRAAATTLSR